MRSYIYILLLISIISKRPQAKIDVYIESLCPDCIDFVEKSFEPYYNFNISLAEVNFIPFGNAKEFYNKETKKYEFECQHKEKECYGNLIETCAINLLGKIKSYEIIICLDKNIMKNEKNFDKTLDLCMRNREEEKQLILDCTKSDIGNYYQHIMATKTKNHNYVPWIVVDGYHDIDAENDMLNSMIDYLCHLYGNDCQDYYYNSKRKSFNSFKNFNYHINRCYNDEKQYS